ncbi:MAG: hypothetical protein KAI35_05960, partial [Desulfobulbaceae bacterium]|nr:hypothetical protein [Desulfobulbaceae bacterium]
GKTIGAEVAATCTISKSPAAAGAKRFPDKFDSIHAGMAEHHIPTTRGKPGLADKAYRGKEEILQTA